MNGNGNLDKLIERKGSVTQGDYEYPYVGSGAIQFMLYPSLLMSTHLPEYLPDGGRERDIILSRTPALESFWGSAVSIAIAKIATRGFEIESDIPLRRKRAHELFSYAVAGIKVGWKQFLPYHLGAYFNSRFAVIEIIRETKAMGSRITGLAHLPPKQCELTGDPDTPVLYRDKQNRWHELKWWQCGVFSDMPDFNEEGGGAGICAAQRAYPHIRKLAALEEYVTSKITGDRPQAIYIVSGMSELQLRTGLESGKTDGERKGRQFSVQSRGALIIPTPNPEGGNLVTIPLAELPDGFDVKQEFDRALLAYANALGLDPQDLQPLTGQALGTGAQSQVLDQKSKGRGGALWSDTFVEFANNLILDESTTFAFYSRDLRDEKLEADIQLVRAQTQQTLIAATIINAQQSLNVLVDEGDLPEEYRATDITQTGNIADDEKPEAEAIAANPLAQTVPAATPQEATTVAPSVAAELPSRQFTPTQVQGIQNIVIQVTKGELGRNTGIRLLVTAYGLSEAQAKDLLDAENVTDATVSKEIAQLVESASKAVNDIDALYDEELARAKRLYEAVR